MTTPKTLLAALTTAGLAAALLGAGATARESHARPLVAPAGGELAFVRWTDPQDTSTSEIYRIRADGRGLVRLTRNRFSDASPIWSPDGTRILFVSSRDGDDELYVMDANGRGVRRLTRNARADVTPQWSPDGRLVAFASDRARRGEPEIWVMRADGGGARRLIETTDHPEWQDSQFSPVWSPDGRRIVFSMTASDANPELYVVGVDGRGLTRLTFTRGSNEEYGDDTMPDWSRDGRGIVFVSNRESRSSDLWTMNADGTRQRPILRRPATDDWNPRLSDDGRQVAFTEHTLASGRQSVWIGGVDGRGFRRIAEGAEPDWRPQPRGTAAATGAARSGLIAFARQTGTGTSDLYVVRPDGGGLRKLSRRPLDHDPAWTPDGKRLVFSSSRGGRAGTPELYSRDLAGRSVLRLTRTRGTAANVEPVVTRDGARVVFVREGYGTGTTARDLYSVPIRGGAVRQLTRTRGREGSPSSGRDGGLVYERDGWIWIYETAAGRTRRIARGVHPAGDPTARGLIAFARAGAIWVVDSAGGEPRTVVEGTEVGGLSQPDWSPDGERLVYVGPDGLYTVALDGSDVRRLTRPQPLAHDIAPAWRPAPERG